jgi:hypothetical protein
MNLHHYLRQQAIDQFYQMLDCLVISPFLGWVRYFDLGKKKTLDLNDVPFLDDSESLHGITPKAAFGSMHSRPES